MDEVRVWGGTKGWGKLGGPLIQFQGEVHSVVSYDKGNGLAVGGTFTSVIVDGKNHDISFLVVLMVCCCRVIDIYICLVVRI